MKFEEFCFAEDGASLSEIALPQPGGESSRIQVPENQESIALECMDQQTNFNPAELSVDVGSIRGINVDIELPKHNDGCFVTCPKCNHTFIVKDFYLGAKRQSPFKADGVDSKRSRIEQRFEGCKISESIAEVGCSTQHEESGVETTVSTTEPMKTPAKANSEMDFRTPDTNTKRRLTLHDHHYETSPLTTKRKLQTFQEGNQKLHNTMKKERQRCARLKRKITSLQGVVSELGRTRALPENSLDCLDTSAESDVSEFLKRFLKTANTSNQNSGQSRNKTKSRPWKSQRNKSKATSIGPTKAKYPPSLRAFALTLHFYSPKAYAFVRRKFCKALPEPSTLRAWYSTIDGEPGFTGESFDALKAKVTSATRKDKKVICSLMLDEIGIKKGINRAPNGKVRGYIDLGTDVGQSDLLHLAKDALVIMVVAVDSSWKLPIGYFLIDGITAETSSNIVSQALTKLHDVGVEVLSLSLDGPPTHFSLVKMLGADFKIPNPTPYFPHPVTRKPVHVIFDACHMLKLFRNCLGDCKTLKDGDGRYIQWKYITELANLQQKEGLRAGNKLRLAHIHYFKMKMKVRLAAQTLSSSVADSLEHCDKILKLPAFKGCEGTVRFIRCIDRLFDFMNSRNPFAKGFKAPLHRDNEHKWRDQILTEVEYLSGIHNLMGEVMSKSKRYVPFVGMVTAVRSVLAIFDDYVKPIDAPLKYLLTYKLSQDHLELFFCAIQSCGGWCPNPTAAHFVSAYKRLLIQHQVRGDNGNVSELDSTKILNVSSVVCKAARIDRYDPAVYDEISNIRVTKKYDLEDNEAETDDILNDFLRFNWTLPEKLSEFSKNSISYIAGYAVRKVLLKIKCEDCRDACIQGSPTPCNIQRDIYLANLHNQMQDTATENEKNISLSLQKNRGGLVIPSDAVVRIAQVTEKLFRHCLNANKGHPPREANFPAVLCSKVLHELFERTTIIFPTLDIHNFDEDTEDLSNHVFRLTKEITKAYIEIRMFSATNLATETVTGMKVRHHLTRQIIWQSQ